MLAVARAHRAVLTQVGSAVLLVGAVRAARQVVLPLWAVHLGLSPATTSLVFGLSGVLDVAVFWPAGKAMDRYGRLWVAVPAMVVLGASIAVLPVVGTLPALVVVAVVMGLGNGIGSGIVMTLAADLAPPDARPQFLGTWRLLQDTGIAVGPLVVSGLAAAGSLALGVLVGGLLGLVAAGLLAVTVPRWSVHANGTTRVRAGLRPDGRPRCPSGLPVGGRGDPAAESAPCTPCARRTRRTVLPCGSTLPCRPTDAELRWVGSTGWTPT